MKQMFTDVRKNIDGPHLDTQRADLEFHLKHVCVCVCVRACVRACVSVCVGVGA